MSFLLLLLLFFYIFIFTFIFIYFLLNNPNTILFPSKISITKLLHKKLPFFWYPYHFLRNFHEFSNKKTIGSIFGEITYLFGGGANVTIIADENDVKIDILDKNSLQDNLSTKPELSGKFYRVIIFSLIFCFIFFYLFFYK